MKPVNGTADAKNKGYCCNCSVLQKTSAISSPSGTALNGWCVAAECGIAFMGVIPLSAAPEMMQSIIFVLGFHISLEKLIP